MPMRPHTPKTNPEQAALEAMETAAFTAGHRYGIEDWMHGLFDRDNTNQLDILISLGRWRNEHTPVNGATGVDGEIPDAITWTVQWIAGHRAGYDAIDSGDPKAKALADELSGE